ncbi:MAG: GGDEF domain-containing protein [Bdellovibrionales bacterium]|nr:GGDEF domain-containing protein [Massilia sp.]
MVQQDNKQATRVGLFLNPIGPKRAAFQATCGEQFGRLLLADGAAQASLLLAQYTVDLLVIDLECFDRGFDLVPLGQLIKQRAGAPTLVICPFTNAGWLPALMPFGPLEYGIAPMLGDELAALVAARPGAARSPAAGAPQLRSLMAAAASVQAAIADVDDLQKLTRQLCGALAGIPGVAHAALFYPNDAGHLQLAAQHSGRGLDLARILPHADQLLESPMRHAFPGLLAAATGDMSLLDAPAKAGEPELARALADNGIGMVLGVPLPARREGAPRGSLCLMFERARQFSADDMGSFIALAQLAGCALRMAEMGRENELLLGRLAHLASTDVLTGVANRRHGEYQLELEAKRARRYKLPLALILFDIDRFKAINDQFGHAVGDAAIRTVSAAVAGTLRASDVLVRSSGEEFQIIAPHTSATDALKLAEKIRAAIAATDIPGCDRVTISLGVGQITDHESADSLTVRVDAALARAKRAGRNCVELARQ